MADTILALDAIKFPTTGAARGITQTLEPIGASASFRRTINGDLIDLSMTQFQKYKSTISCTDQSLPTLDGIWPGAVVVVDCIQELAYVTAGGSPSRTVVTGSSRVDGSLTYYRPRLTMMVTSCPTTVDEWQASRGWTLELEET
jgi:hypothetical protein